MTTNDETEHDKLDDDSLDVEVVEYEADNLTDARRQRIDALHMQTTVGVPLNEAQRTISEKFGVNIRTIKDDWKYLCRMMAGNHKAMYTVKAFQLEQRLDLIFRTAMKVKDLRVALRAVEVNLRMYQGTGAGPIITAPPVETNTVQVLDVQEMGAAARRTLAKVERLKRSNRRLQRQTEQKCST